MNKIIVFTLVSVLANSMQCTVTRMGRVFSGATRFLSHHHFTIDQQIERYMRRYRTMRDGSPSIYAQLEYAEEAESNLKGVRKRCGNDMPTVGTLSVRLKRINRFLEEIREDVDKLHARCDI